VVALGAALLAVGGLDAEVVAPIAKRITAHARPVTEPSRAPVL
jgi:hypothetical protein